MLDGVDQHRERRCCPHAAVAQMRGETPNQIVRERVEGLFASNGHAAEAPVSEETPEMIEVAA